MDNAKEVLYTKSDLVSFGNYLLSDERRSNFDTKPSTQSPPAKDRRKCVNDVDFDHWAPSAGK